MSKANGSEPWPLAGAQAQNAQTETVSAKHEKAIALEYKLRFSRNAQRSTRRAVGLRKTV